MKVSETIAQKRADLMKWSKGLLAEGDELEFADELDRINREMEETVEKKKRAVMEGNMDPEAPLWKQMVNEPDIEDWKALAQPFVDMGYKLVSFDPVIALRHPESGATVSLAECDARIIGARLSLLENTIKKLTDD